MENELKKAGRAGQLPSGVVLTGGTANLANIVEFARTKLGLAARVGQVHGLGGAIENIEQPEYAAACGLMLIDSESALGNSGKKSTRERKNNGKNAKQSFKKASNGARKFLGKFKV